LETFYRERAVHTCPSKHVGRCLSLLEELEDEMPSTPVDSLLSIQTPCSVETRMSESWVSAQASYGWCESAYLYQSSAHLGQAGTFTDLPASSAGVQHADRTSGWQEATQPSVGAPRTVLSLSAALEQEAVGVGAMQFGILAPECVMEAQQTYPGSAGGHDTCRTASSGLEVRSCVLETLPQYLAPALEQISGVSAPPSGPAPGSPDLPSVGSIGHAVGNCKPCAFLHTRGCENDLNCQFCHLCGPEVRKARKLEKVQQRREANRTRKEKKVAVRHCRSI